MNKRKYIKRNKNKNKKMKLANFKKQQEIELNEFMKNKNEIIEEQDVESVESVKEEDEIMVENEIIEEKRGDNELMNKIDKIKKNLEKMKEKQAERKIKIEKGPSGDNEIPAKYKLTKNEYLMYLYENILSSGCNTESLIRFIIMALPGMSFDDRKKILKEGPKLSSYSSSSELVQYAFGRLIQYKSQEIYKRRIEGVDLPKVEASSFYGCNFNYYHIEDVENHKVYLTNEPPEPIEPNLM